jgi:hypothetical protein
MAPPKANLVMVQGMQFAGERLTKELSRKLQMFKHCAAYPFDRTQLVPA